MKTLETETSNELPEGWELCLISDIFQIRSGYGFPKDLQSKEIGLLPFFKVGDISRNWQKGHIYLSKPQHYITEDDIISLGIKEFPEGSVVFAKIGAAVALNRRAILKQVSSIDNNVMSLPPNEATIPEYTFHFMCQVDLGKNTRGGNVPSLRNGDVGDIKFPLPPLNEQKRIVAKIEELFSELDAGEQSLRDARQKLTLYRQSLLKQAFEGKLTETWRTNNPNKLEDPKTLLARIQQERASRHQQQLQTWQQAVDEWEENGKEGKKPAKPKKPSLIATLAPEALNDLPKLPSLWKWCLFGEVCDFANGDRGKNYPNRSEYVTSGIPWINTGHIEPDGSLSPDRMNFITREKFETLNGGHIQPGDLVYCLRGATFGKTAFVKPYIEGSIASSLMIIRPVFVDSAEFVYRFLLSPLGKAQLTRFDNGTAQPNLSANSVRLYEYPLCSLPEQQEIVRLLDEQFTAIEQNEKEITHSLTQSQALRQSILKKAFSGKLE